MYYDEDREKYTSALLILQNLALENDRPWWAFWRPRFTYSAEPLRHDAANLLRRVGFHSLVPIDTHLVGDGE